MVATNIQSLPLCRRASYAYDANGNLTSRAGKALTWNADNTLASMVGADTVSESYTYDGAGQRVTRQRAIPQPSGTTTVYLGGLYEEEVPGNATKSYYTFAGKMVAVRAVVSGAQTVTYLHGDHLGSVSATSNAGGALNAQQLYTPFGAVRQTNGLATKRGFTGQYADDTGLSYYGALRQRGQHRAGPGVGPGGAAASRGQRPLLWCLAAIGASRC